MSRSRVTAIAAFLLRWSGIPFVVRHTIARDKVCILLYHDPSPRTLERHLAYLSRRFALISLDQLVDAIRRQDRSGIPRRSVVVTLDDGHRGNVALRDVFRRFGVVPTIYLCSQVVGTRRRFWFRIPATADLLALKRLPQSARLEVLRRDYGFTLTSEAPEGRRQALSRAELAALAGEVDFGAHTRFHPILTTCSAGECATEIGLCKEEVERLTGASCRHFSYPNGDFTERERELARAAGFASARGIDFGWNDMGTDPYALRVVGWGDQASVDRLAADLAGASYLGRVLGGNRSGRYRPIVSSGGGA